MMLFFFDTAKRRKTILAFVLCLLIGIHSGCGRNAPRPVNIDVADAVLKSAFDSWKSGESIQDLKQQKDSIVVQESDWSDGLVLVSYKVLNSSPRDSNLIVEVELELKNPSDDETTIVKKREYIVSSHPAKTVFRNLMN